MKERGRWIWLAVLIVVPAFVLIRMEISRRAAAAPTVASAADAPPVQVVTDHNPPPRRWSVEPLKELFTPPYSKTDGFQFNLSHWDLTGLDLTQNGGDLVRYATFDTATVWPKNLPAGYEPARVLALGKEPGLGVRDLHQSGVTGWGVRVAIIDQTLILHHQEYDGRIAHYTEVGSVAPVSELHGPAVASILAGKNVGVAPDVTIDYYAAQVTQPGNANRTFRYVAWAINKILDDNRPLPLEQRVRVISLSVGASPNEDGYPSLKAAYGRAVREGVLVVSTDMGGRYRYQVMGLGRAPEADPNKADAYGPGSYLEDFYYQNGGKLVLGSARGFIYTPMDSRTVASESGPSDYRFYRIGGLSWSVPYLAGTYALAAQVYPQVTPEEFLQAAYDTGDYNTVVRGSAAYKLGPILNPSRLIEKFRNKQPH